MEASRWCARSYEAAAEAAASAEQLLLRLHGLLLGSLLGLHGPLLMLGGEETVEAVNVCGSAWAGGSWAGSAWAGSASGIVCVSVLGLVGDDGDGDGEGDGIACEIDCAPAASSGLSSARLSQDECVDASFCDASHILNGSALSSGMHVNAPSAGTGASSTPSSSMSRIMLRAMK